MKTTLSKFFFFLIFSCFLFFLSPPDLNAQEEVAMRRPISPQQPMWLIHIDTWNYADPQKIIDLIPEDIRPYAVMNISLSISHNEETGQFHVAEYGYEVAKSWLRVCADNRLWAVIQPSSGGYCHFSDFDLSVYHEFFREYPNFIGFNYCEQFWGYDSSTDKLSPKWMDRISHFANLLKLSSQYGGYLIVSWCGNQWSPNINPIAMLKRNDAFEEACRLYPQNYILCEKYTQQSYQYDMESLCLGAYLSGYSGQYGIRYDNTGWSVRNEDNSVEHKLFTLASAGAVHMEHMMLTGQTVVDGPEIIWHQCFRETGKSATADGYNRRNWSTFARFDNVMIEYFRKIIDGTIRIPSRKEVIDRTKVVIINDVNTSNINDTYSSPETLFQGLYRMDNDGNYQNNTTFFKKTGRYPAIPTVFALNDDDANSFQVQVNRKGYNTRWPNIATKMNEFDALFPEEYTGDIYAGRHENGWVTYNPFRLAEAGGRTTAKGSIPFKYNTCDRMELSYSEYTAGVIKEYADKVTFFLSNYDDEINTGLKPDTIWIYGSTSKPTWTYEDKGNHQASIVTENWSDNVFYLAIQHNGSIDITINCSGTAENRLTDYTTAIVTPPAKPAIYTGARQYEAECFDLKRVREYVSAGHNAEIRNYTGQGYVRFGNNRVASIRDTVRVLKDGIYKLETRYSSPSGNVGTIDLYINGVNTATPAFMQTASKDDWAVDVQYVTLKAGYNSIAFTANSACPYTDFVFDNIVVSQEGHVTKYDFNNDIATTEATTPAAQFISVLSGSAGVVSYTNADGKSGNSFKAYSVGNINGTGIANLELFPPSAQNYAVVWKEYFGTTGASKGILMRAGKDSESCVYAEGMKQGYLFIAHNTTDNKIELKSFIAHADGLTEKQTYHSSFVVDPGKPCWFRAIANGNRLSFECSPDSINWFGGEETEYTDNTYTLGATQLVWGMDSNNFNWVIDDLSFFSGNISTSRLALNGFLYAEEDESSPVQSFSVSALDLFDNLVVEAPQNYEISLDEASGYQSSLRLNPVKGSISETTIYVRLKFGLVTDDYFGSVSISSKGQPNALVAVSGSVTPKPLRYIYDFTADVASNSPQTPPAKNITVGEGNSATGGVVSFQDSEGQSSNMFKPYAGGQRNATGVMNLNLFPQKATDYSVTWKQYLGTLSESKIGVLLRGDTEKTGDASTGYVQGIMQGYLFIAYTVPSARTDFRIYRSTGTYNSLELLVNTTAAGLKPTAGQPVWFRASVSGSSGANLLFEYSTDGITWYTGASTKDEKRPRYESGATQIVWGLAAGNLDFYLDDIAFDGFSEDSGLTSIDVNNLDKDKQVLAEEYYTIMGQRVYNTSKHNLKGFYIVKSIMSDGSFESRKVYFK